MNPDDIFQTVQKSFRVTLGAAGTLVDSLQNPQNGEEVLNKLRTDPNQLAEELAIKGEATEIEARKFVDTLMAQSSGASDAPRGSSAAEPTAPLDIQNDLEDLITQISALRKELTDLQNSGDS